MNKPVKKIVAALLTALVFISSLAACKKAEGAQDTEEAAQTGADVVEVSAIQADPQKAIDEIYAQSTVKEVEAADDALMESLGFDLWQVEDYYVRYSSGRYGLADVFIVKPYPADYDTVREIMENIKADRVKKTESYDILDAHNIAQDSTIFQYGSYLIMLMLEDNDAALEIIKKYIPSTEMAEER